MTEITIPNHHSHHGAFSGLTGSLAALSMSVGRDHLFRLAADAVDVTTGDHVVDVGCGPGVAAREVHRRGADFTGVDPSELMLRWARRIGGRGATWVEGTAEALPLPDRSATIIWSLATVHHWLDVVEGLGEAHRVLASGGRLLVAERDVRPGAKGHASHGWIGPQADAFATMCGDAGFDHVTAERLPAGRQGTYHVVRAVRP